MARSRNSEAEITHFVYILRSSKDSRLYTGCTHDLMGRLEYHFRGSCTATKHRRPLELVYVEEYCCRKDALERERCLKSLTGGNEKFALVKCQSAEAIAELKKLWVDEVIDK